MIIGPKYKIARRLGAGVFEKTEGQKFALSLARRQKQQGGRGPKSDYGIQMLEKQKARFSYALTEKQFSNYVKKSLQKKGNNSDLLYGLLESRLDNAVLRSGFVATRLAARQMVSHGHLMVNGTRVTIPSYQIKSGDVITIREGSKKKTLFSGIDERLKNHKAPSWLAVDPEKQSVKVQGAPKLVASELLFNIGQVLEFYSR
jgi:small subunit ribosomal protein S4